MCLFFSIATTQEIPSEIKKRYEQNGLVIDEVREGDLLRVLNIGKYHIYIVDDGVCSCNFFVENERAIPYQTQIRLLIQDLYARKMWIQCFLHNFQGEIIKERIHHFHKEKISLDEFVNLIPNLQEDVIYQLY